MKNKIIIIASLLFLVGLSGCTKLYKMNQPEEPEIEYSVVWPMSGEWYVTYGIDGNIVKDYTLLYTYNTASESTSEFWISDGGNTGSNNATFWSYCVKTPLNLEAKTFSGTDLVSTADWQGEPYSIKVNITNGKVIKDGTKSKTGVVSDSIYFEIEFEDDPGTIFQCSGHRRTGFLEDEF